MAIMENRNKKKLFVGLAAAFAVFFLGCAVWLIVYLMQNAKAGTEMEEIKVSYVEELVSMPIPTTTPMTAVPPTTEPVAEATAATGQTATPEAESAYPGLEAYDVPQKNIDFAALQSEENEHIYAWITVPGTVIDYPVLQHPEEIGYYLNHNLDHSTGYPGCVFSQLYNSKNWDDPNTVLYGHNMKNGTMFAGLHQYEDSQFFEENPYVYIYTEDKVRVYEIFASYEYTDVDLVLMYLYGGEETYKEYLDSIYTLDGMNNNFNTEITVTTEDKMLTLATCISDKPDRRYLVQAVLLAEGEAQ